MGCKGSKDQKQEPSPVKKNPVQVEPIQEPITQSQPKHQEQISEEPQDFKEEDVPPSDPAPEMALKFPDKRVTIPTILYYFDYDGLTFHYYNMESELWKTNDLRHSTNNCPNNPLIRFKDNHTQHQAKENLSNVSLIAVSNNCIYLIGGFHPTHTVLMYNIADNNFVAKERLRKVRSKPNLCCVKNYIYCISGDEIDYYSTRFDRYDKQANEWVELPPLPEPHALGSSHCVVHNNLKIMVVGGFSSKIPPVYNKNISVFDFYMHKWYVTPLEDLTPRVPKFIRAPIVQDLTGSILILGEEKSYECFEFDIDSKKLITKAKLNKPDDHHRDGYSSHAAYFEESVAIIYKRGQPNKNDHPHFQQCLLSSDLWEFV